MCEAGDSRLNPAGAGSVPAFGPPAFNSVSSGTNGDLIFHLIMSFNGTALEGTFQRTDRIATDYIGSPACTKAGEAVYEEALKQASGLLGAFPSDPQQYKLFLLALRATSERFYRSQLSNIDDYYHNLMSPRDEYGLLKRNFKIACSVRETLGSERERTRLALKARFNYLARSPDPARPRDSGLIERLLIEKQAFEPLGLIPIFRALAYLCFLPENVRLNRP